MLTTLNRNLLIIAVITIGVTSAACQTATKGTSHGFPAEAEIRALLARRMQAIAGQKNDVGIVVGVICPEGKRVISYGRLRGRRLDGDTIFEIGSVGKVFTALLLADMVQRGEVKLDDGAIHYLPSGITLPERGRAITLADLATHTSGLPFMPYIRPVVSASSSQQTSADDVYAFLARYRLTQEPGSIWEYSNLGYWILGQALAGRAGMQYDTLLEKRILSPLRMQSTKAKLSPEQKRRVAVGHDASSNAAIPFYDVTVYSTMGAAAGGVYSTADDLLRFLSGAMGYAPTSLTPAMSATLETHRPISKGKQQALGWVMVSDEGPPFVFHDGGTWGFSSAVAWDPQQRRGVVVLSNSQYSVSDIARHLLRPEIPGEDLSVPKHREVKLRSSSLETYVGEYRAEEVGLFKITRNDDVLVLSLPPDWGLPDFRLRAESANDFFVSEMPIRVQFSFDQHGRTTKALVYPPRGQRGIPAKRENPPPQ